jgi:hypothetical protein
MGHRTFELGLQPVQPRDQVFTDLGAVHLEASFRWETKKPRLTGQNGCDTDVQLSRYETAPGANLALAGGRVNEQLTRRLG